MGLAEHSQPLKLTHVNSKNHCTLPRNIFLFGIVATLQSCFPIKIHEKQNTKYIKSCFLKRLRLKQEKKKRYK